MTEYDIHEAPGPLIRRFHQIGLSIFASKLGALDITPLQFSIMWMLKKHPEIDQITLAQAVALDRTTCSNIVNRLERKGRIQRKVNPDNRRAKLVSLTPKGRKLLDRAMKPHQEVQQKLLEPLTAKERELFLHCLHKLVNSHNDLSRAPLRLLPLS